MDNAQYADLFLTESREHLSAINHALLGVEQGGEVAGAVDAIFRAVHTIKGMSATMGYVSVAELSHEMESALEEMRRNAIPVTAERMDLLFQLTDILEQRIEATASASPETKDAGAQVLQRLRDLAPVAAPRRRKSGRIATKPATSDAGALVLSVRLAPDAALPGVRAMMALEAAKRLGRVLLVEPPIDVMQGDDFNGEFTVHLATELKATDVEQAIRRVGDVLQVVQRHDATSRSDSASEDRGTRAVPGQPDGARRQHNVRIDLRRLDSLMNLVGELVVTRGRLTEIAGAMEDAALSESVSQASRLIGDLRDEIVSSRMVPVWQVFDRFPRLVRDAARSLDKEIEFTIEGKDIELDRSMLEEIGDPIVHLLRNAVDHGMETTAERRAAGKPARGSLVLSATRDRAAVVIRVSDDGRGIDRDKVLMHAKQKGLVEAGKAELSDDDLLRIIARPGFSTADRVTDLSGRGVGVDAVYTRVRSLGGAVDIRSVRGRGTTVTLRLPITLAIVRALLARAGSETYAIPLTHVSQTVELDAHALRTLRGREVLMLEAEVLPLLRLRSLVGEATVAHHASVDGASLRDSTLPAEHVVVIDLGDHRAGLVVDELTTQQEIVVKQFDGVRGSLPIFGGATILGDGSPALIIDLGSLL